MAGGLLTFSLFLVLCAIFIPLYLKWLCAQFPPEMCGEGLPVLLDAWNQISTWQLNRRAFVAAVVARLTLAAAASHTAALGWLLWQLHTARLLLLEELLEKVEEAPQLINNRQVFPRACAYRYLVAITTYLLRLPDNQLATPPLSRSLTPTCSPACAAALLAMMCAVHPVKIVGIVHQAVLGGCLNWSVALPLLDQMVQHCPGSCSPLQSMVEDVQSAAFEAHSTSQFSAVLLIRRHVPLEALSAACPSPLSHYAAWLQKLLLGAPGEDGSLSGGVAYHAKGLQLVKATVQGMVETDALNVLEAHRKAFKEAKKLALGARQREAVDDYLTIVEPYIHELQPQATESERALALLQQPAPSAEAMAAAQQLLDAFARSPHDAEAHFRHIYTWKKPEYARLLAALQYPCADAREVGERLAFLQAMHRAKPFSLVKGSDVADFQSACAELQRTFGGRAPSAALRGALAGTSQGLLSVIEGVVDAISNASPSVALEVLQRMDRAVGKELDAGQQGKPHALPASIITEHLITAFGVSFASTGPNHRAWCLPFVAVLHGHAALHAALLPRLRRLVNEHCLRDALTPEQVSGLAGLLMFMATSQHASRGDKQTTPWLFHVDTVRR
ncbi:hypothetical protein WJX72_011731 [[Myrmecia] bisecta]|uniref:Uncharacterized protein n=1 Tax=[Myrmecia] bisecta TaxID=41462 RepID=A0AAW1QT18_9CHLO